MYLTLIIIFANYFPIVSNRYTKTHTKVNPPEIPENLKKRFEALS